MAKKTRIDRRGKIRSLTRKQPPIVRLQWRKAKTLAVLARRRFIDDVWLAEFVTTNDEVLVHLNKQVTEIVGLSDTVNLNGEKIIIDSPVFSDDGFVKDFSQPGLADIASMTDSIGFKLQDNLMLFNNNEMNSAEFNAIAYDLVNVGDTMAVTDSFSFAITKGLSDSAITSDKVEMSLFVPNQPMNTNIINLATLNG
jgi:hypothetical protein